MSTTTEIRNESERICNLVPSRNLQDDWGFASALAADALESPVAALSPSVNLRADWWNIGNQGSTGSCVGWASTDGVLRYHMVKSNRIPKPGLLSSRCTWMASKETDEFTNRPQSFVEEAGTSLKAAMIFLNKYGAVPESLLPFKLGTTMYAGNENAFYANAASRRITAYYNLGKNLTQWRTWLATQGPFMAGLKVDKTWDNATSTKGNLDTFQPNTARGGHAICVVGYTADKRFIIRNSWGEKWGDEGFAYASEAYINAGFFNESYGITV
jgi:C1A family cysteine protease